MRKYCGNLALINRHAYLALQGIVLNDMKNQ